MTHSIRHSCQKSVRQFNVVINGGYALSLVKIEIGFFVQWRGTYFLF